MGLDKSILRIDTSLRDVVSVFRFIVISLRLGYLLLLMPRRTTIFQKTENIFVQCCINAKTTLTD